MEGSDRHRKDEVTPAHVNRGKYDKCRDFDPEEQLRPTK